MAFPYTAIAGKDRVLFETYESWPDLQLVATSYSGSDEEFPNIFLFGYLGGVQYFYISNTGVGEFTFRPKNLFASQYYSVALNEGNFAFQPDSVGELHVQLVRPDAADSADANMVFSFGAQGFTVNYYENNTLVEMPIDATFHLEIGIFRNQSSKHITGLGMGA